MSKEPRKGAISLKTVPADIIKKLNEGEIEAANLMEGLSIDLAYLLRCCFPKVPKEAILRVKSLEKAGITQKMAQIGEILLKTVGLEALDEIATHPSDTVRGWGAYMVAKSEQLSFEEGLLAITPFAKDAHFGVREWAQLAFKPKVVASLAKALKKLTLWAEEEDPFARRFAVEVTRPRGVWCAHIPLLKQQPELALPLLEKVKEDPVLYVQKAVGNWLNDAAKSKPEWVKQLCLYWEGKNPSPITQKICRRGLRSVNS